MTLWADGGNVTVSNLVGQLHLDTGGGDLTGTALTGTLEVNTEGGNVNAGDWIGTGTMRLDTGGGDLSVNGFNGNFQLATEGGNVDASGVTAATSTTQSGGGDVTLAFTQVPKSLTITAEGGNVTVILPPGDTKYDISTPDTAGGNVSHPGLAGRLELPPHDHHRQRRRRHHHQPGADGPASSRSELTRVPTSSRPRLLGTEA